MKLHTLINPQALKPAHPLSLPHKVPEITTMTTGRGMHPDALALIDRLMDAQTLGDVRVIIWEKFAEYFADELPGDIFRQVLDHSVAVSHSFGGVLIDHTPKFEHRSVQEMDQAAPTSGRLRTVTNQWKHWIAGSLGALDDISQSVGN